MTLSEYEEKTKQLIDFMDEMGKRLKKISEDLNKKPREMCLYYHEYGRQWRSIDPDEALVLSDDIEIIHVKEVIE